jgi:hypothetical protein
VKYLRSMIIVLGITFVSLSSMASRVDAAETAYNETDVPVNVTTPFVVRSTPVIPNRHIVIITRQQLWCEPATAILAVTAKPDMRASHSLLNLLCKLLC